MWQHEAEGDTESSARGMLKSDIKSSFLSSGSLIKFMVLIWRLANRKIHTLLNINTRRRCQAKKEEQNSDQSQKLYASFIFGCIVKRLFGGGINNIGSANG